MKDLIGAVVYYYELFFSKVSGNKAYQFNPKPNQTTQINNFLNFLDKKIGLSSVDDNFLFDFMSFQFEKRKDLTTRFGKGIIPLNHVIGKKAYERWERKSDNWAYWVGIFLKNYKIERPIKESTSKKIKSDSLSLNKFEENLKEQFMGSRELLFHCMENTTLHNPKSRFCKVCPFAEECKNVQSEIYPDIYEARKENL